MRRFAQGRDADQLGRLHDRAEHAHRVGVLRLHGRGRRDARQHAPGSPPGRRGRMAAGAHSLPVQEGCDLDRGAGLLEQRPRAGEERERLLSVAVPAAERPAAGDRRQPDRPGPGVARPLREQQGAARLVLRALEVAPGDGRAHDRCACQRMITPVLHGLGQPLRVARRLLDTVEPSRARCGRRAGAAPAGSRATCRRSARRPPARARGGRSPR